MITLKIAARNILKNKRRSLMTISVILVAAMAMILFGGFVSQIFTSLETTAVENAGHLTLYRKGYFDYGSGNPGAYGIADYQSVLDMVTDDPVLKPMLNLVTPTVSLFGIAGNFEAGKSKTFFGRGVVPADFNRMRIWNEHQIQLPADRTDHPLNETDETHGIVGIGLARILGLGKALNLADPGMSPQPIKQTGAPGHKRDFSALEDTGNQGMVSPSAAAQNASPRLDLLAATAMGAPNVVNFYVDKAVGLGSKEADENAVLMNITLAQNLLYGRGEHQVLGVVVQLNRTEDMTAAKARLEQIIREKGMDLEVRDLNELQPFYKQVVGMFKTIFMFIAIVMGVITLSTVANAMGMSVMERTPEIGTLRAMGVKQREIAFQFVLEGLLLGMIGATLGLLLGSVIAQIINHLAIHWMPPGQATPIPLLVRTQGVGLLVLGVWAGVGLVGILASWLPAWKAAKLKIVDALGHV